MKLASVRSQDPRNRNGEILVVSKNNKWASRVDPQVCVSLLEAIEDWGNVSAHLHKIYESLNQGTAKASFPLDLESVRGTSSHRAWFLRRERLSLPRHARP